MRKLARAALPLAAAATALMLTATVASAAAYQSSDRWASYNNGGYTVYNDEWGSGYGSQTLWANTYKDWGVYSTQPATSGVKSLRQRLAQRRHRAQLALLVLQHLRRQPARHAATGRPRTTSGSTAVRTRSCCGVNKHGNVGPLGSSIGNLSLDGQDLDRYVGNNGANPGLLVRPDLEPTTWARSTSWNLLKWMQNTKHYFSNPTLSTIQFGFEISGTGNTQQNFTVTNYSAAAS